MRWAKIGDDHPAGAVIILKLRKANIFERADAGHHSFSPSAGASHIKNLCASVFPHTAQLTRRINSTIFIISIGT